MARFFFRGQRFVSLRLFDCYFMILFALSRFPDPAPDSLAPQPPQSVTTRGLHTGELEILWPAVAGDFETYLFIVYNSQGAETNRQYIAKDLTFYRFRQSPGDTMWTFHSVKGGIMSVNANVRAGK